MNDALDRQVRQIAADIFNLPLDQVTRATSPDSVEHWDSVQHLNFVLAMEQSLEITLEPEDIDEMRSVGAAIDVAIRKQAQGS
jgi:acyl carrier protein